MPIMSGYDACLEIKKLIQNKIIAKDILIVAQTADCSEMNIKKCKEVKFDGLIYKPIKIKELQLMI